MTFLSKDFNIEVQVAVCWGGRNKAKTVTGQDWKFNQSQAVGNYVTTMDKWFKKEILGQLDTQSNN